MRNVFVLANAESAIYNFRRELIQGFLDKGYHVTVAFPRGGSRTDEIIRMGCAYVDVQMDRKGTNPIKDIKLIGKIHSLLKQHAPDILLTFTIKPNLYGGFAASMLGIPHIGNITGLGSVVKHRSLLQKVTLQMYRMFMKNTSLIFFQNNGDMTFMQTKGIAKANAMLLPGSGVNLSRFKPMPYPTDDIIRFSYIGRVMREKGIEHFLEAAKAIKATHDNTEFHIIGPYEENYKEVLEDYERKDIVVYHGAQNDVREFHRYSHCTIHPSFYPEGMSNVLLESAASARPVITTSRDGCKETVEHGISGFIVPERDSQELIERIEQFIHYDSASKMAMGLAGRKKVEREFDRNSVVETYLHEVGKIIGHYDESSSSIS